MNNSRRTRCAKKFGTREMVANLCYSSVETTEAATLVCRPWRTCEDNIKVKLKIQCFN